MSTYSNEISSDFKRIALIPLIQESDIFYEKHEVNSLTETEMLQEMENRRMKATM